MELGTGHPVRLTSLRNDEKFCIGMIPGMIGCLIPNVEDQRPCDNSRVLLPTRIPTAPDPGFKPMYIVKQLSDDEIRTGIAFALEPFEVVFCALRVFVR